MIKDKLQIILVTYNRKELLKNTFEEIFAETSPIKDCDIAILDNCSNDGTSELIDEYQIMHPNIKHIRNKINIGGCGNVCKAFEMASSCNKEYAWILCDDDVYNLSKFDEVEKMMNEKKDIICMADYEFLSKQDRDKTSAQMVQLTFIPASLFRTEHITDSLMVSMYESTFTLFPQLVFIISVINNGGTIGVLSKPVVFQGAQFENKQTNRSYIRGGAVAQATERKKATSWILGYANILTMLHNKKLINECMEKAVQCPDIYNGWGNCYNDIIFRYFNWNSIGYFHDIYRTFKLKRKILFWIYFITPGKIRRFIGRLINAAIILKIKLHNFIAYYRSGFLE